MHSSKLTNPSSGLSHSQTSNLWSNPVNQTHDPIQYRDSRHALNPSFLNWGPGQGFKSRREPGATSTHARGPRQKYQSGDKSELQRPLLPPTGRTGLKCPAGPRKIGFRSTILRFLFGTSYNSEYTGVRSSGLIGVSHRHTVTTSQPYMSTG
jgi:hypothetical protein